MTTNRMGLEQTLSDGELTVITDTDHVQCGDAAAMARELLAYRKASKEAGKMRRFDLDMSNCDSCGQDCGADMVEDLDGEYVLWEEVIPYLYQHAEYTAPPIQVATVPDELLSSMEEVIRISDREHEAWTRAKANIKRFRAAMLKSVTNEP